MSWVNAVLAEEGLPGMSGSEASAEAGETQRRVSIAEEARAQFIRSAQISYRDERMESFATMAEWVNAKLLVERMEQLTVEELREVNRDD